MEQISFWFVGPSIITKMDAIIICGAYYKKTTKKSNTNSSHQTQQK